jgi:hypothetical protein
MIVERSIPDAIRPAPATLYWRVHERGRVTHLIIDGAAVCGEPGTGWRAVAGTPRCPACQQPVADQYDQDGT